MLYKCNVCVLGHGRLFTGALMTYTTSEIIELEDKYGAHKYPRQHGDISGLCFV